jgi:hypothetical protein
MPYLVPPVVVPALMALLVLAYAAYRPPLADDPSWPSAARLPLTTMPAPAVDPGGAAGSR